MNKCPNCNGDLIIHYNSPAIANVSRYPDSVVTAKTLCCETNIIVRSSIKVTVHASTHQGDDDWGN